MPLHCGPAPGPERGQQGAGVSGTGIRVSCKPSSEQGQAGQRPTPSGPTGQTRGTRCVSGLPPRFSTGGTLTSEPQVSQTCHIRSPGDQFSLSFLVSVLPHPPT